MDPLADATPDLNPYQFAAGDPVNFNDPHGDLVHEPPTFSGGYLGDGGGGGSRGGGGLGFGERGYGGSPVNDWGSGFYGGGPAGIDLAGGDGPFPFSASIFRTQADNLQLIS